MHIPPAISEGSPGYTEIKELIKLLAQEPGVEAVRAMARNQPGEITIELLSSINGLEQVKLKEKAVDLVTETKWKLLDSTDFKDWYLNARVTKSFEKNLGYV